MRISFCPFLLITSVLATPLTVSAAEWSVEPSISLRGGYNDNIRMTPGEHDSVWETDLRPAVKFGVSKENQGLFGNADVGIRRFYGGSGRESSSLLNREDVNLKVNAYHTTPRNNFSGFARVTRDSTLDSELDETGQVIEDRATRLRKSISPSWAHTLDEKTILNLNSQFTTVDYSDEVGPNNLINYDFTVYSAALLHQFTPRLQATLSSAYSRYKPETNLDSDTVSVRAGLTRNHTETLTTSWLAGWRRTNTDTLIPVGFCIGADPGAAFPGCSGGFPVQTGTDTTERENTGAVYNASIVKKLETGSLSASITRIANPGGNGQLLDTKSVTLAAEHKFTETLSSSLTINRSKQDTIANSSGGQNRNTNETFLRITPRITWHWTREWGIAGQYRYSRNKDRNSADATQNAVYLTLTYRPTKLFESR